MPKNSFSERCSSCKKITEYRICCDVWTSRIKISNYINYISRFLEINTIGMTSLLVLFSTFSYCLISKCQISGEVWLYTISSFIPSWYAIKWRCKSHFKILNISYKKIEPFIQPDDNQYLIFVNYQYLTCNHGNN